MKNKLIYLFLFILLAANPVSLAMFQKASRIFKGAGKRLRSDMVDKFLRRGCSKVFLAKIKNFVEIVESPINTSQGVVYSEKEYLSMASGFDYSKGVLRKSVCPFFASLCNESNDVEDKLVAEAVDTLKEHDVELMKKMGHDIIYDYLYDYEFKISFDPLYHAVRMNKGLDVIKKLVQECDCDVNFNVFKRVLTCEIERVMAIVLCPTPLFWAFLHGNYEVARYLILQGAHYNVVNACNKTPMDMAKDTYYPREMEKEIQV